MSNIGLQAPTLTRKCDISHWLACGAKGSSDVRTYGHVHVQSKISWIDRITKFS